MRRMRGSEFVAGGTGRGWSGRRRPPAWLLLLVPAVLVVTDAAAVAAAAGPPGGPPTGEAVAQAEGGTGAPLPSGEDLEGDPAGRVLLLSLPGLTWADVQDHDLPVIESFLAEAAIANHAPRGARVRSTPGGAYLTISAGSRAVGQPSVDGQQLDLEDRAAGSAAGEIFERRMGVAPEGDYVALAWPSLLRRNQAEPYDAEPGLLYETLAEAGLGAGVIGNADGTDTVEASYERQVGLATVTPDGVVSSGDVDVDLLVADLARPFGRRLDVDRVVERFSEVWAAPGGRPGGLVVVEASDLARTMRYRARVDSARYDELWRQSLIEADHMVGRLLAEVDLERDSVILLAPYNLPGDRDLTVAALQTRDARAGMSVGYLRTASTQRSGFVTLVDVAPTVLRLLDVERPAAMEGRPFEVVRSSRESLDQRVDRLVSANAASRFREHLLVPTTLVIVVCLGLVAALAIAGAARPDTPRGLRRVVSGAALFTLAVMPMSYLARGFPLEELGLGFYWGFVLSGALLVAAAATMAAAVLHRPRLALVVTLVFAAAVPAFDVMTGSRLSMSAAFGYSPTGNSRLYGISNYALGMFGAAICLLAGLMASRDGEGGRRRWRLAAVGLTVGALAVIGAPIWGANVGGILSFSPVVVLFAGLVLGTHLRLRSLLVGFVVITGAAVAVFASLDLARPPEQRAHLGRLVERIGDEGPGPLFSLMHRKGLAAIEVSVTSFWTAAVVIAVVLLVALRLLPDRPLQRLYGDIPWLRAGLLSAFAAAVFGSIANDSGSIVGGTAMLVVVVTLICLVNERLAVAAGSEPRDEVTAATAPTPRSEPVGEPA